MTARPGRLITTCHALRRVASITISAAVAAAAGTALGACHVAGHGLPGFAAAAALAVIVFVADRWFCSLRPFTRWLRPRRGWRVRAARLRDDVLTTIRGTWGTP